MFLVIVAWLNINVQACDEPLALSEWLPLGYSGWEKQPPVMA